MFKDGDLQVGWDGDELIITFSDEVDEDGYSDDQYIIDKESAYTLYKFLSKKFQERLLKEPAVKLVKSRLKIEKPRK